MGRPFGVLNMNVSQDLIGRCIQQERRAQSELYRICYGYMMSICLRYERNKEDATSLVNLSFLKVLQKLDKLEGTGSFKSWMRRIVVNTIIDEFRKRKKDQEMLEFSAGDEQDDLGVDFNEADEYFTAEMLEGMLQKLPEINRKVFNLYAIEGYSHKEIAEQLNIPVNTSKWHLASARKLLQGMMTTDMQMALMK